MAWWQRRYAQPPGPAPFSDGELSEESDSEHDGEDDLVAAPSLSVASTGAVAHARARSPVRTSTPERPASSKGRVPSARPAIVDEVTKRLTSYATGQVDSDNNDNE